MHYSFVTVLGWTGTGYINDDMPILASDNLYSRMPDDDTRILLLSGRQEGYTDMTLFFSDVCNVLDFNPFKVAEFKINSDGLETMEKDVIDTFMGEYREDNSNILHYWRVHDSDHALGGTWLSDGYGNKQATYGQTNYGGQSNFRALFYNCIRIATFFSINDGVTYEFEIWPESSITSGVIDTSHFQRNNENQIRTCHIFINIWQDPDTKIYNFAVQLGGGYYTTDYTNKIDNYLNGADLGHIYNPDNPYDNKQDEGNEGGDGPFDNDSDPVDVPDVPSIDITALGGLNLYKLTAVDMAALFSYLGSNDPGNAIVKWFTNPIQAISACYMLPYPVPVNGSKEVTVLGAHTGVTAYSAGQWTEWNLGAVKINQGFGDCFLDYSNFTRVSIFLPFIGVRQLNADDIIGNTIGIKYQFDNISGACSAYITVNGSVRYTFSGSCAVGIPISQSNWGQTYMAAATAAAGALAGGFGAAAGAIGEGAGVGEAVAAGVMGAVKGGGGLSAFSAKPTISRSGSVCGAGAAIGLNKPVMFIERPDKAKIEDPKSVIGITSGRTLSLGALSGYNAIEHVHLHGIGATGPELDEIERLLYQGVIF